MSCFPATECSTERFYLNWDEYFDAALTGGNVVFSPCPEMVLKHPPHRRLQRGFAPLEAPLAAPFAGQSGKSYQRSSSWLDPKPQGRVHYRKPSPVLARDRPGIARLPAPKPLLGVKIALPSCFVPQTCYFVGCGLSNRLSENWR